MLIAISGSQGSGKTTVLEQLESKHYPITHRKIARSILADWNITLKDVNESPELTLKFQDEVTERKWKDEKEASDIYDVVFTERTHADVFTYTLITLGLHNQYSDWVNQYYDKCLEYNQHYSLVYYLTAGHFSPEHDGTRGSNQHYSRMVDVTMLDLTRKMIHSDILRVIETPDLDERVNKITNDVNNIRM